MLAAKTLFSHQDGQMRALGDFAGGDVLVASNFFNETGRVGVRLVENFENERHKQTTRWHLAVIENVGMREVLGFTVQRGEEKVDVFCTPDHMWPCDIVQVGSLQKKTAIVKRHIPAHLLRTEDVVLTLRYPGGYPVKQQGGRWTIVEKHDPHMAEVVRVTLDKVPHGEPQPTGFAGALGVWLEVPHG